MHILIKPGSAEIRKQMGREDCIKKGKEIC